MLEFPYKDYGNKYSRCHCEEPQATKQSRATSDAQATLDRFAALAMTVFSV
ncbi:MAG: hypothetical protein ABTQ34_09125 [Bdellovibrionales bacterium]